MNDDHKASGYWRKYRSMMDHPLHPLQQRRAFTEFEALEDLIDNAAGRRDGRRRIVRGQVIAETRGCLFVSLRFLKERWRWGSVEKVRRFLRLMQKIGTLEYRKNGTACGTLIEIVNYQFYNPLGDQPYQRARQRAGQTRDSRETNINKEIQEIHREIVESWNAFASRVWLAQVRQLTKKRKSAVSARLKESGFNLDEIYEKIEASDFLRGNNDRGWRADFDFVFGSPNNYVKILEGKYDNRVAEDDGPEYEEEP